MAAHSVQEAVTVGHAHPPTALGHRGTQRPLVGVGVKTLHRAQTGGTVTATHCIQSVTGAGGLPYKVLFYKVYLKFLFLYKHVYLDHSTTL